MDLLFNEDAHPTEPQVQVMGSTAKDLQDVQDQAAAWLREIVLKVVPGWAAQAGCTDEAHG